MKVLLLENPETGELSVGIRVEDDGGTAELDKSDVKVLINTLETMLIELKENEQ